nr:hypothetical protein OH837_42675 [Streptomyces canus]
MTLSRIRSRPRRSLPVGTAVPDAVTTYDADTGEIASVASGGKTITHTYDALDREISYNDGSGNTGW